MTKSKSVPAIPAKWTSYIKGSARSYAYGMFAREDAEQTALEAFIRARSRHVPAKGAFDHYAKAAIRNALLNARIAEQRNYELPANPDEGGTEEIRTPLWAAEGAALGDIDDAEKLRAVLSWTDSLPSKLSSLYRGLYSRDMSQREFAAKAGVSQAAVSQRNRRLVQLAQDALAPLAAE